MCLILFSWRDHPSYDLVLAANRDEFYDRPTLKANYWEDNDSILGGRDSQAGGTWIGINQRNGKLAALTNYRDPANVKTDAPSRGQLTSDFLTGTVSPKEYLLGLQETAKEYNGFNLLLGDTESIWYFNNVNLEVKALKPGTYGLSNGLLDSSWPKIMKGKQKLGFLRSNHELSEEQVFPLLNDKEIAGDEVLPSTGVSLEMERSLSPMFIEIPNYGTRCSTMILRNRFQTTFVEKTHAIEGVSEEKIEKFEW